MNNINFDLKQDKLSQLADIFRQENIVDNGVYHIQRNVELMSKEAILLITALDLEKLFEGFSTGEITYGQYVERENVQIISLTIRLESSSIVKYTLTSNTNLDNRLRLNFSVKGRVFEYDDTSKYLQTSLKITPKKTLLATNKSEALINRIEVIING